MLIAEFAETTGLTRDAVRFYVKHGLLRPSVATSGNRYQHFDESDIERVVLIQSGQALGFTIRPPLSGELVLRKPKAGSLKARGANPLLCCRV